MIIKGIKSFGLKYKYSSFIISSFLTLLGLILYKIANFLAFKSPLNPTFRRIILPVLLFLFIVFLPIAPPSQIQFNELSSTRINLSQSQYGIVFVSATNILLLLLIFYLSWDFIKLRRKLNFFFFEIVLIIFFITSEISTIMGVDLQASTIWLLKFFLSLIVYFIFSKINLEERTISFIIFGLIATIFLEGFVSVLQFANEGVVGIAIESIDRLQYAHQAVDQPIQYASFRVVGTLSHPNYLTNYLALLLPVGIFAMFSAKRKYKISGHLAVYICFFCSLIALSRWGLASSIFAYATTFFLFWKYGLKTFEELMNKFKIDLLVISFIIILLIGNGFGANRFLRFSLQDNSLLTRIELVDQSLEIIKENPLLGVGGGGFLYYFANYDYTNSSTSNKFLAAVHNFPLLIASEQGLIGLTAVFLFAVSSILFILKFMRSVSPINKMLALSLFASYITFFFNSIMTMRSFGDRVGILFFLIFGLLINILSEKKSQLPVT